MSLPQSATADAGDLTAPARSRIGMSTATALLAAGGVAALVAVNAEEVGDALGSLSAADVVALAALHFVALFLRAEAWGLSVAAGGAPIGRRRLHGASSLRFLADTVVPTYVGAWVRIALLKRLMGKRAPTIGQMITADGVILLVEAFITVGLLVACSAIAGLSWEWPLIFFGIAVLAGVGTAIVRRRFAHRPFVRAFDVLSDARARVTLTILLVFVLVIQPVRFYIALRAVGLDADALNSLLAFVTTSIINGLPVGPGPASVGATVTVFGQDGVGAATASGLVLAGTAVAAAAVYSLWGVAALLMERNAAPVDDDDADGALAREPRPAVDPALGVAP